MLKLAIIEFYKSQQPLILHLLSFMGEEAILNAFVAFLHS